MRVAVSSDWHGNLPRKDSRKIIEESDLLLLAGDLFQNVLRWEFNIVDPVAKYLKELKEKGIPVILTPGNHDFHLYNGWLLEQSPELRRHLEEDLPPRIPRLSDAAPYSAEFVEEFTGAKVLVDQMVEVKGVRIYGTPWTPEFYNWAFMLPGQELRQRFSNIPGGVDILVSHGPPRYGSLDVVEGDPDRFCGSVELTSALLEKRPKWCFCGHIHTGDHNETKIGNTICQNVSLLDEEYKVKYPIKILEV